MANYDSYGFNKDKTKYDLTQIQQIIDTQVKNAYNNMLNAAWPKGSIIMLADADSPNKHGLPGTWSALPGGYYLYTQSDGTPLQTGGSNSVQLTINNIPKHSHRLVFNRSIDRYAPYGTVRLVSGTDEGVAPTYLYYDMHVRRGEGDTTTMINAGSGSYTDKWSKNNNPQISPPESMTKAFDVSDQTGDASNKLCDVIRINITGKGKIDGTTDENIYNSTAWANRVPVSSGSLYPLPVTFSPRYITVRAWQRTN